MRFKDVRDILFIVHSKPINDRLARSIHPNQLNFSTFAPEFHDDLKETILAPDLVRHLPQDLILVTYLL